MITGRYMWVYNSDAEYGLTIPLLFRVHHNKHVFSILYYWLFIIISAYVFITKFWVCDCVVSFVLCVCVQMCMYPFICLSLFLCVCVSPDKSVTNPFTAEYWKQYTNLNSTLLLAMLVGGFTWVFSSCESPQKREILMPVPCWSLLSVRLHWSVKKIVIIIYLK